MAAGRRARVAKIGEHSVCERERESRRGVSVAGSSSWIRRRRRGGRERRGGKPVAQRGGKVGWLSKAWIDDSGEEGRAGRED